VNGCAWIRECSYSLEWTRGPIIREMIEISARIKVVRIQLAVAHLALGMVILALLWQFYGVCFLGSGCNQSEKKYLPQRPD
jgi:hypothetical protein